MQPRVQTQQCVADFFRRVINEYLEKSLEHTRQADVLRAMFGWKTVTTRTCPNCACANDKEADELVRFWIAQRSLQPARILHVYTQNLTVPGRCLDHAPRTVGIRTTLLPTCRLFCHCGDYTAKLKSAYSG